MRDGHLHQRMFRRCLGEMLHRLSADKRAAVMAYWNRLKDSDQERAKRPSKLRKLERPLRWLAVFWLPVARHVIYLWAHIHKI